MRESKIETYLRDKLKALDCECLKFTSPGLVGVPDRIVLAPDGSIYFVELKSSIGVLKAHQMKIALRFAKKGHPVWVVNSIDVADRLIYDIRQKVKTDELHT